MVAKDAPREKGTEHTYAQPRLVYGESRTSNVVCRPLFESSSDEEAVIDLGKVPREQISIRAES